MVLINSYLPIKNLKQAKLAINTLWKLNRACHIFRKIILQSLA